MAMTRRLPRTLLCFLLACLLAGGCAPVREPVVEPSATLLVPTDTITPTRIWFPATATYTRVAATIVTPTPAAEIFYGDLALADDFSDHDAWVTGSYADGNVAYGNNTLALAVANPGGSLTSFRKETYFTDFYAVIQASANLCSPQDSFGVSFWAANARNYYRLAINCSGAFRLEKVKENKVTDLTDWQNSDQLMRGPMGSVKIGLWSGGGLIRVYFNDLYQSEIAVSRSTGGLGLFTISNSTTAVTAVFSKLEVYEVLPEHYPPTATPTVRPTKTPLPTIPTP